jgi:hypothetical protein
MAATVPGRCTLQCIVRGRRMIQQIQEPGTILIA